MLREHNNCNFMHISAYAYTLIKNMIDKTTQFYLFFSMVGAYTICTFLYVGYKSLNRLKLKRLIEGIPDSKIKSMAVGLVEVKGHALPINLLHTPITNKLCVLYMYKVFCPDINAALLFSGDSLKSSFLLEDKTGITLINPCEAEINLEWNMVYESDGKRDSPPPASVAAFLKEKNSEITYNIFRQKIKIYEACILPEQPLFVLGYAKPWKIDSKSKEAKKLKYLIWKREIKRLKGNKKELIKYDLNGDGKIDANEWEQAKVKLGKKIIQRFDVDLNSLMYIDKGPCEELFCISVKSEKELITNLLNQFRLFLTQDILCIIISFLFLIIFICIGATTQF